MEITSGKLTPQAQRGIRSVHGSSCAGLRLVRGCRLLVVLLYTGAVVADSRLTMEEVSVVASAGADAPKETRNVVTLWLAEDRAARIDSNSQMIVRIDRGESYLVNHAAKSVFVAKLDGLPETLANARPERTGETRTVGPWTAERYDLAMELAPGQSAEMVLWVSDQVDIDMAAYRSFMRSMDRGQSVMSTIASLPGYPVLQEMSAGIVTSRVTLLEVADEAPPAGVYEPPADYETR